MPAAEASTADPARDLVQRTIAAARRLVDAREAKAVPAELKERWRSPSPGFDVSEDPAFSERLRRDRCSIVPWLHRTRPLRGQRILEVGCGEGASTIALAEQGAEVVALDIDEEFTARAATALRARGLAARFVVDNAANIGSVLAQDAFDWVIFWATLEHMTLDERLDGLRGAWDRLEPGGLLTVIETPNRLWYHDSHTSQLPFYMWLPDELAYRVSPHSPRPSIRDHYRDPELRDLAQFRRRGRGVSHHEFDVALGREVTRQLVSCYQVDRRHRQPMRRIGWRLSMDGRYERLIGRADRTVPVAFLQPFLYLTIRKPHDLRDGTDRPTARHAEDR